MEWIEDVKGFCSFQLEFSKGMDAWRSNTIMIEVLKCDQSPIVVIDRRFDEADDELLLCQVSQYKIKVKIERITTVLKIDRFRFDANIYYSF